ncbi:MAG: murein transglycosylase A [Hyphomicrobiaceae bacterium]
MHRPAEGQELRYHAACYSDVPGWDVDNHAAAFRAFLKSCAAVEQRARSQGAGASWSSDMALLRACAAAQARVRSGRRVGTDEARGFFEHYFRPYRLSQPDRQGLLTGYFEPVLVGARERTDQFNVPLYRRPPDLEAVTDDVLRAAPGIGATHKRRTADGLVPYFTRREIEAGALAGQGLELIWLADPVDAFFVQVQGSGLVRLTDGSRLRITYDGKNGHPYRSVGRRLIEQGAMTLAAMSLQSLGAYLRADRERGRKVMQHNESFVFFRALTGREADSPHGALDIPLTPGRSLAVDGSTHTLGMPVFVDAPTLTHAGNGRAFRRLMIAQDVGSAIAGPERGDIYFGSGDGAGAKAGITKHKGSFYVLKPVERPCSRQAD